MLLGFVVNLLSVNFEQWGCEAVGLQLEGVFDFKKEYVKGK